ncbi:ATP-binding cassette domain-containing protein [Streptomyces sp. MCA2]|uniref:ABC transporter ATP-binding protein n=1 Tax=Streptomyces TaxID=1883 RepID=UPI00202024DF|nr:ATP-binding cassette domain-containing protein [Streptomyces sp. MCA2]MCL7490029.1 ATP-binding cassette domain-containing protein [Streptomyces sp. MCA2]
MKDPAGLEFDSLSKSYGDTIALSNMTFAVRPGEIFGFVGGNGAGKTTTMRIAVGVLRADDGQVRWRGRPVGSASRASFGYMPEERGLYPKMTVSRQLVYLAQLHGLARGEAVQAMHLWTERLEIAEHRNKTIDSLSLGNQQRVQLAAALIHGPQALLLDEPFSGLDPIAVDTMSDVLTEKASEGVPVLFSSHQLDLVERLCDRVGIVRSGSMVACGTVAGMRGDSTELYVEIDGATEGWAAGVDGISWRQEGIGTVIGTPLGFDDTELLHAAIKAGQLRTWHRRETTLTEMFRSYVSDAAEEESA